LRTPNFSKKLDYKEALEAASRGMILVHDPQLLIKMIIRMIVYRLKLRHAGMIIYSPEKNEYLLAISKGQTGHRIPQGFARFNHSSPIIKVFSDAKFRPLFQSKHAILWHDMNKMIWQEGLLNGHGCDPDVREILHQVSDQMDLLGVVACVPAIYHDKLLAVLLLGEKQSSEKFDSEELSFFGALASDTAMALRNAQLFDQLRSQAEHNHDLFLRMTMSLGAAIEVKDEYTKGHSEGVTRYALAIAQEMNKGGKYHFDEKFMEDLYVAGTLHDIGKIGVPESILNKPGRLTPEEYALVKRHPVDGVAILKPLSELERSMAGIRYHHERHDGKGYPDGLKGDEIPIIAAIIAVADTFDSIVTQRPYRPSRTPQQAMEEIVRNRETQFHPEVVDALERVFSSGGIIVNTENIKSEE